MKKSQASVVKIAQFDWLPRMDFILDHAAEDVWPLIVHWEKWIRDYRSEHVSGKQDTIGEIKKISKLAEDGKVQGYFFVEVVRLIPGKRLVYRILPLEKPAFEVESIRGYEIFNLYEINEKTFVTYETVAQLETSLLDKEDFNSQWRQAERAGMDAWSQRYVPELKKLLKK